MGLKYDIAAGIIHAIHYLLGFQRNGLGTVEFMQRAKKAVSVVHSIIVEFTRSPNGLYYRGPGQVLPDKCVNFPDAVIGYAKIGHPAFVGHDPDGRVIEED